MEEMFSQGTGKGHQFTNPEALLFLNTRVYINISPSLSTHTNNYLPNHVIT